MMRRETKMKKIKMLTTGPNKNYRIGQVIAVDKARADYLIKTKQAVEVK